MNDAFFKELGLDADTFKGSDSSPSGGMDDLPARRRGRPGGGFGSGPAASRPPVKTGLSDDSDDNDFSFLRKPAAAKPTAAKPSAPAAVSSAKPKAAPSGMDWLGELNDDGGGSDLDLPDEDPKPKPAATGRRAPAGGSAPPAASAQPFGQPAVKPAAAAAAVGRRGAAGTGAGPSWDSVLPPRRVDPAEEQRKKEAEEEAKREAERKAKEEAQRQEEERRKAKEAEEREAEAQKRKKEEEEEKKKKEEEERRRHEEEERRRREDEDRRREEELRKKDEEERRRKDEEERRRREEQEEQRRREEEERRRREEEERRRREEEDRRRQEEEERRRKEEELRLALEKQRLEEEERRKTEKAMQEAQLTALKQQLEEERRTREEESKRREEAFLQRQKEFEARLEEMNKTREALQKQKEEAEMQLRQQEERRRLEEEERRREEERKRTEEERRLQEERERKREQELKHFQEQNIQLQKLLQENDSKLQRYEQLLKGDAKVVSTRAASPPKAKVVEEDSYEDDFDDNAGAESSTLEPDTSRLFTSRPTASAKKEVPQVAPPVVVDMEKLAGLLTPQLQSFMSGVRDQVLTTAMEREELMIRKLQTEFETNFTKAEELRAARWQQEMEQRAAQDKADRLAREERERLERVAREEREREERAFREQREQQERLVREQAERDERLVRLKAELEEREAWTKRERDKAAAEQKQALERLALQNKIALEQATRQAAQTIQEMEKRMSDEKRHLREVHKMEIESMQTRNLELAEVQEKQHAHSLAVYELHTQNANSIREVLAALEQNIARVEAYAQKVDTDRIALLHEREVALQDRDNMIQEVQRNVLQQQDALERERLRLSNLFVNFEITMSNIEKKHEEERVRLAQQTMQAQGTRAQLEKEFRCNMQDFLAERSKLEEERSILLYELQGHLQLLQNERRELEKERQAMQLKIDGMMSSEAAARQAVQQQEQILRQRYDEMERQRMLQTETEQRLRSEFAELQVMKSQLAQEKDEFRVQTLQLKELSLLLQKKSEEATGVHQEALQQLALSERLKQQCDNIKEQVEGEGDRLTKERERIRQETLQCEKTRLELEKQRSQIFAEQSHLEKERQQLEAFQSKLTSQLAILEQALPVAQESTRGDMMPPSPWPLALPSTAVKEDPLHRAAGRLEELPAVVPPTPVICPPATRTSPLDYQLAEHNRGSFRPLSQMQPGPPVTPPRPLEAWGPPASSIQQLIDRPSTPSSHHGSTRKADPGHSGQLVDIHSAGPMTDHTSSRRPSVVISDYGTDRSRGAVVQAPEGGSRRSSMHGGAMPDDVLDQQLYLLAQWQLLGQQGPPPGTSMPTRSAALEIQERQQYLLNAQAQLQQQVRRHSGSSGSRFGTSNSDDARSSRQLPPGGITNAVHGPSASAANFAPLEASSHVTESHLSSESTESRSADARSFTKLIPLESPSTVTEGSSLRISHSSSNRPDGSTRHSQSGAGAVYYSSPPTAVSEGEQFSFPSRSS